MFQLNAKIAFIIVLLHLQLRIIYIPKLVYYMCVFLYPKYGGVCVTIVTKINDRQQWSYRQYISQHVGEWRSQ